jgi:outer membrane protein
MKIARLVWWGMFLVLFAWTGMAQAADKFAYIDLSRTFSEYNKTKDYDKVLGDKETVYTTERDKKINDIKSLQDKINLLSEKEKETKRPELDTKLKSLEEFRNQKEMDLRKEQDEKMREILKDIEDAVKKYAEKEGYTMVFNDRVLVYQTKSLEITDKVIEILNKGYTKK